MTRLLSLKQWRAQPWKPRPVDRERQQRFLEEHVQVGGEVHVATAAALEAAFREAADAGTRRLLYLRLFAEYVNALEHLGAWGWAIRNRNRFSLLLDGYLAYAPGEVGTFYSAVRRDKGDLSALLRLPPADEIVQAFARSGVPAGDLRLELGRCASNLRQAAVHYAGHDELLLANYNKAKHGITVVRTPEQGPEEFWVLSPQRDPTLTGRYLFSKLSATPAMVAQGSKLVRFAAQTTTAVVSLARNLDAEGML